MLNPNNWYTAWSFIAVATLLSISCGWSIKSDRLPIQSTLPFSDRFLMQSLFVGNQQDRAASPIKIYESLGKRRFIDWSNYSHNYAGGFWGSSDRTSIF